MVRRSELKGQDHPAALVDAGCVEIGIPALGQNREAQPLGGTAAGPLARKGQVPSWKGWRLGVRVGGCLELVVLGVNSEILESSLQKPSSICFSGAQVLSWGKVFVIQGELQASNANEP